MPLYNCPYVPKSASLKSHKLKETRFPPWGAIVAANKKQIILATCNRTKSMTEGRLKLCRRLATPDANHVTADADLMGALGYVVHDLLKLVGKKALVVLGTDSVRRATRLRRAEERVLQTDEKTGARFDDLGHALSPRGTHGRIHSNQELE